MPSTPSTDTNRPRPAAACRPSRVQPRQLRISTHEGGADGVERQRQQTNGTGRRLALMFQLRILIQDGGLQLAQVGPGLDPQLLCQDAPRALEGRQRVPLPAGAIQREHQLTPEPLSERMLGDERLELGDQLGRSARGEIGVDPVLEGDDAASRSNRRASAAHGSTSSKPRYRHHRDRSNA